MLDRYKKSEGLKKIHRKIGGLWQAAIFSESLTRRNKSRP